jgi:hypothetical protein
MSKRRKLSKARQRVLEAKAELNRSKTAWKNALSVDKAEWMEEIRKDLKHLGIAKAKLKELGG